jgi:hypothetical protein
LVRVRRTHATAAAMHQAALDADAAWPAGRTAPVEIRLLDLAADPAGTLAARTARRYRAEAAALVSATPAHVPEALATEWTLALSLGQLHRLPP